MKKDLAVATHTTYADKTSVMLDDGSVSCTTRLVRYHLHHLFRLDWVYGLPSENLSSRWGGGFVSHFGSMARALLSHRGRMSVSCSHQLNTHHFVYVRGMWHSSCVVGTAVNMMAMGT